jgi:hypothetical protein
MDDHRAVWQIERKADYTKVGILLALEIPVFLYWIYVIEHKLNV